MGQWLTKSFFTHLVVRLRLEYQGNNFPQSNQCKEIHYFQIGRGARFQKHKTQTKSLT